MAQFLVTASLQFADSSIYLSVYLSISISIYVYIYIYIFINCSPNKVDNRSESRLYHLYNAICCFEKRDSCPYSSLKKKIFDFQIFYADKLFSLFPINPLPELVQNLENISISREYHENNKNPEGEIKNHLVDLQISLGKKFHFWIFML